MRRLTLRSFLCRTVVGVCLAFNVYVCKDIVTSPVIITGTQQKATLGNIFGRNNPSQLKRDVEKEEWEARLQERRSKRRAQTRPPEKTTTSTSNQEDTPFHISSFSEIPRDEHVSAKGARKRWKTSTTDELCGELAKKSAERNADSFFSHDALNENSRVFIHGILTPLGFHLALAIEERCGAKVVTGFENGFPNTVKHQMERQERLGILVSQLHLERNVMNAFAGLDQFGKPDKWPRMNITGEVDLMKWQPTHMVNLASYAPEAFRHDEPASWRNDWDPYTKNGYYPRMYGARAQMVSMEQILASMALMGDKSRIPHFLYASSSNMIQRSRSSLSPEDQWQARNSQLSEVLADTYHQVHGVYSVALRFPNAVYGNYGYSNSDVHRILEKHIGTIPDLRYRPWTSRELDMVHMDDIIDLMIAAMQFRRKENTPVVFTATAGTLASHNEVDSVVKRLVDGSARRKLGTSPNPITAADKSVATTTEILGWTPRITAEEGLLKTTAWYLQKWNPYGSSPENVRLNMTRQTFLEKNNGSYCRINDSVCRSSRRSLPCASECNFDTECSKSAFDPIVSVAKRLSKGCRIVVYTYSLDAAYRRLPSVTEGNSSSSSVCYIAVINKKSHLWRLRLSDTVNNETGVANLRLWQVIPLYVSSSDNAKSSDVFLLKHTPGSFFNEDVKFAMFVESSRQVAPSAKTAAFLVSQLGAPSWTETGDPNPKHERPPAAGRSSMLLPQLKYADSKDMRPLPENSPVELAEAVKYMLFDVGMNPNSPEPEAVETYRLFLERIPTFTDRREFLRSVTEPFFPYGIHHWTGSGWVVHDLSSRDLRCDWFSETVQWEIPVDQLSLAHVLARRAMEHCHKFMYPQMEYLEQNGIPFVVSDSSERLATPETHRPCPVVYAYAEKGASAAPEIPLRLRATDLVTARIFSNSTMHKARYAWEQQQRTERGGL